MFNRKLFISLFLIASTGCNEFTAVNSNDVGTTSTATGGTTTTTTATTTSATTLVDSNGTLTPPTGTNVMTVQVGGTTLCTSDSYVNEPCTSVTICAVGSSTSCQTINNILVDTGSYGLRIFSSAISVALTQATSSLGGQLAECAYFGTGSTWGPVKTVNVILGQEAAVTIPIQVINSAYAKVPSPCGTPDTSPSEAGYNGILGVGLMVQDCGSDCVTASNNQMYYSCVGTTCTQTTATLAQQVSNPVASLAIDNNGVTMIMPTVAFAGNYSTTGYLLLGVGTQANNTPASTTQLYTANSNAEFTVSVGGANLNGFIDSGSNGIFIPATSEYADCASASSAYAGWLCPSTSYTGSGTTIGVNGVTGSFQYQIGNAITLFGYEKYALMNLGGSLSTYGDLGLPFFYGKTIYVGLEGKASTIGTGPYWAY